MDDKLLNNRVIKKDIDIVYHLSLGMSVPKVAETLGMKTKTVEARIMRLRSKMQVGNIIGLVAYFLRNKIIN